MTYHIQISLNEIHIRFGENDFQPLRGMGPQNGVLAAGCYCN